MRDRVIGVIDLQRGRAVRGVGGQREHYRPVQLPPPVAASPDAEWVDGSDPLRLARFYLDRGVGGLYVADLDALTGRPRQTAWLERLAELGVPIWIDAGFREDPEAAVAAWPVSLRRQPQLHWILATEAIGLAPPLAARWVAAFSADRVTLSIDLFAGRLLLPPPALGGPLPGSAATVAVPGDVAGSEAANHDLSAIPDVCAAFAGAGVRSFLLLDLRAVGGGKGPEHLPLCHNLKAAFPDASLLSGGGVGNEADLAALLEAGVDQVLVASALQNGAIFRTPGR